MEPADDDGCTAAIAWHVTDGAYGEVTLDDQSVAMLIAADESVMFDPATQWDVVLVVDDAATDEERGAIEDIYLGRASGIWSPVADGHLRSTEVTTAPIEFERDGDTTTVSMGTEMSMEAVERVGFNGEPGTISPHPLTSNLTMTTAESTRATVSYDDRFDWDVGGNNAFVCEFELTNA
jgi:hypothetical protein